MPLRTIIVDDERPARDELAFLLKSFPEVSLVAQGKNGLEAVALVKEFDPDLLFLDVQMPGLDGLGVIKKLAERKLRMPQIIFATAYDHYAVHAFEVSAVDYILKPFDKGRIAKAIQRARKHIEAETPEDDQSGEIIDQASTSGPSAAAAAGAQQPVKLLVKSQSRLLLIDAQDLIFATIEDGSITITAREIEGSSNFRTIDELAAALDPNTYWRPHRSYLVNINHIQEVVPWFKSSYVLKMNDKRSTEVPVSRAQTKRLRELLKL